VDKGQLSELGALLPPGVVHRVEVRVVRGGDPRTIVYAVIVRTRTELPVATGPCQKIEYLHNANAATTRTSPDAPV
jgi:hypothetical protein